MKTKLLVLTILWILAMAASFYVTYKVIANDYKKYITESKCAMDLVHSGINRKDISTFNGTCKVKE